MDHWCHELTKHSGVKYKRRTRIFPPKTSLVVHGYRLRKKLLPTAHERVIRGDSYETCFTTQRGMSQDMAAEPDASWGAHLAVPIFSSLCFSMAREGSHGLGNSQVVR